MDGRNPPCETRETRQHVHRRRDALVVLPTGAGKSLMYQLPAVLQDGITVVVSPLIALMKDQTDKLEQAGVDALTINSGLTGTEKRAAEAAVANGGGEILYVTPERFRDRTFFDSLLDRDVNLTLLKREGAVREHRGGGWERIADDVSRTDLQADLLDYEARREADRRKLQSMVAYCRTARCRTRFIMEYFGLEPDDDYICGHCDAD